MEPTQALLCRVIVAITLITLCSSSGSKADPSVIPYTDSRIVFVGRSTANNQTGRSFDMPGCQILFSVSVAKQKEFANDGFIIGADGELSLQLIQPQAAGFQPHIFRVFVDGQQTTMFNTSAVPSAGFNLLPPGMSLSAGTHLIRIFKSTEAQWNARQVIPNYVTFQSITLPSGVSIESPPELPSRRLEFFGDSITAGYCNLCQVSKQTGVAEESYWDSWANRICEETGSVCHTAAWSGFGVIRNCCGGTTLMSDVYRRTLATVASSEWDFDSWIPDAVVINLGTNDHLSNDPDVNKRFVSTYTQMIGLLHYHYREKSSFFLACGPMSEAYCPEVDAILNATQAAGIKSHFLDQRNFLNSTNACCGHPSVTADIEMAANGTSFIKSVLNW